MFSRFAIRLDDDDGCGAFAGVALLFASAATDATSEVGSVIGKVILRAKERMRQFHTPVCATFATHTQIRTHTRNVSERYRRGWPCTVSAAMQQYVHQETVAIGVCDVVVDFTITHLSECCKLPLF